MAKVKRGKRLSLTPCPKCGEKGGLKKIVFGMPGEGFDFDKYIVGGCLVSDSDPEVGCTKCGWEGMRGEFGR